MSCIPSPETNVAPISAFRSSDCKCCAAKTIVCRVGFSATAAPLDLLAQFLVGEDRRCRIAEARIEKEQIVEVFSPIRRDPYPPAGYTGARLYAELAQLIRSRQSVIVFTNVRSAAEQIGLASARSCSRNWRTQIETHHASLDRSVRLEVEDRLKNGELRAVVCSTSLELGIDIGAVDLVVMVATPKGVSRAIQRIGRSGHSLNRNSHGILVATNVNDLVEATVTAQLVRERALDPIKILDKPYDVVAQHIVGIVAAGASRSRLDLPADHTGASISRSNREEFDRVLRISGRRRRIAGAAIPGVFGKIRLAMTARSHWRIRGWRANFWSTSERLFPRGSSMFCLNGGVSVRSKKDFIKRLQIGDLFVLGGRVVRLIDTGVQEAYVERADGQLPTIPRWNAAKMPLTSGVARAVRQLRADLARQLRRETNDSHCVDWLVENYQISIANAEAIVEQFRAQLAVSEMPIGERC